MTELGLLHTSPLHLQNHDNTWNTIKLFMQFYTTYRLRLSHMPYPTYEVAKTTFFLFPFANMQKPCQLTIRWSTKEQKTVGKNWRNRNEKTVFEGQKSRFSPSFLQVNIN